MIAWRLNFFDQKARNSYNFYGRFNIPLGQYVHFGLEGYFNQSTTNRKTDYIESQYDVNDYNYTNPLYNDYVTTETSQLKADRNYNISTIALTSPVGLEYKVGKKRYWSLRIGSIFTRTTQTINDAKQKGETAAQEEMKSVTGDISLPPGMKLPF